MTYNDDSWRYEVSELWQRFLFRKNNYLYLAAARVVYMNHQDLPDTWFQRWLVAHDACLSGRMRVDGMSPEEFVRSPAPRVSDLDWLYDRVHASDEDDLIVRLNNAVRLFAEQHRRWPTCTA